MAKFWKDLPKAASVENSDKVMIGNDKTGTTCYADVSMVTEEVANEINRVKQTVTNLDGAKATVNSKSIQTPQELYAMQTPGLYGVKLSTACAVKGKTIGSLIVTAQADQKQAFTQLFIAADDAGTSDVFTRMVKAGDYQDATWNRLLTERDLNDLGSIGDISELDNVKKSGEYYGKIGRIVAIGNSFRLIVVSESIFPNKFRQFLFMCTGVTTRIYNDNVWSEWKAYETIDKVEEAFPEWLKKLSKIEIGWDAVANEIGSIAIGHRANSLASNSISIGSGAHVADNNRGIVLGIDSINTKVGSVILGNMVEALAEYEWVNSLEGRFVMRTRFINNVMDLQVVTDRQGKKRLAYFFEPDRYKQLKATGSCYFPVVTVENGDIVLKGKIDAVAVWNFETPTETIVSPRIEGDINWSVDLPLGHLYLTPPNFEVTNLKNGDIYFVIQLFE